MTSFLPTSPEPDVDSLLSMSPPDVRDLMTKCYAFDDLLIIDLLRRLKDTLLTEPNILFLNSPISVCGDIHGQLFDLFSLFAASGDPPDTRYLFLGDYVDRGHQSVLTFLYLAYLKVKYPDSVFLLRGNHETRTVSRIYGFLAEIKATYVYQGLFEVFNLTFDSLPLSAVVDRRWFCVHGGICPEIIGYRRIHTIDRECCCGDGPSVATGLLWSDPDEAAADWGLNLRGAGYTFGRRQVEEFLSRNRLRGIVRSHQLADEGFRWFFDKKLALVWSAPNYTYKCDNQATVMKIKGDEEQFRFFEPDARSPDIPSACGLAEYFA